MDQVLNVVTDATQKGIEYRRGSTEYDAFSQMRASEDRVAELYVADRQTRTGGSPWCQFLDVLAVEPTVVIAPPPDVPLIKRMSTLKRRADVSPEVFRREWQITHAEHLLGMPGVVGYVQNLVTAWGANVDSEWAPLGSDYDLLPIDGMVELWFPGHEELHAAFSSPEGQATMRHAQTFIEEINTYLVETPRRKHGA